MVTEDASGLVTAVNSGAIITGPVVTPITPTAPGALAATTPLAAAPGLAGTAGIQSQLDAEALTRFVQGLSGVDAAAADLAGVAG